MNNLLEVPGRLLSTFPFLISPFLQLKKSGLRIVYYHKVGGPAACGKADLSNM